LQACFAELQQQATLWDQHPILAIAYQTAADSTNLTDKTKIALEKDQRPTPVTESQTVAVSYKKQTTPLIFYFFNKELTVKRLFQNIP